MKILFVTPLNIFPPYWGGGLRTYELIKYLSREHKIFLLYPNYKQFENVGPTKYRKKLENLGIKIYGINPLLRIQQPLVKYINPEIVLKGLQLIISKNIDLIICDYPWAGIDALAIYFLTKKPIIFIEHNVEFLIKEQLRARYIPLLKMLEKILCKHSKKIITVSEIEKQNLCNSFGMRPEKIFVLENGYDKKRFYPNSKNNHKIKEQWNIEDNPLILFDGKLDYAPNREALFFIYYNIMPKVLEKVPNAKFMVVGGGLDVEFIHPSLIFTGLVDKIEDYINAVDVVIVPIITGGGTRIKIIESIACGKTVVSTTKGAEGLVDNLTKPFLKIADDWDNFSDLIAESIQRKNYKKVPKEFKERYSWVNIYKKIEGIIK
jgi:glycosyltransferase involved in cell wall biosynthesis